MEEDNIKDGRSEYKITLKKIVEAQNEREKIANERKRLLAARSPHLPGYSWSADWVQWMRNNHPLLGICCKYRENPVSIGQRIIILVGSISFGLAATNFIYLFYNFYDDTNGIFARFELGDGSYEYVITYEMICLWTFGSMLHSTIDILVWNLNACYCCISAADGRFFGCFRSVGRNITRLLSFIFVSLAGVAVLMRANFEEAKGEITREEELIELELLELDSFSFLNEYLVELVLVYFVYFPIIATLIFAGVFYVGGRPEEIWRQNRQNAKNLKKFEQDNDSCDKSCGDYNGDDNGDNLPFIGML